jgi:hypothetical protein
MGMINAATPGSRFAHSVFKYNRFPEAFLN